MDLNVDVDNMVSSLPKTEKNVVCVLSGGLDSTILLYLLKKKYNDKVIALTMDYGQRHNVELEKAKLTCKKTNTPIHILPMNFISEVTKNVCALSGYKNVDVPDIKDILGDPQPVSYVPFRNMMFLTLALCFAESNDSEFIFIGLQSHDLYMYWDTTPEFMFRINHIASLNRQHPINIMAPFVEFSKKTEIKLGLQLDVPFEDTHTCFPPGNLVHTEFGLIPIELINVNDKVWTHSGKLKKVTNIMTRDYCGELYHIQPYGSPLITCTSDHPIYTDSGFKSAKDLNFIDRIPIIKLENNNTNFSGHFSLTNEFAFFLGHFAAEGSLVLNDNKNGKGIDISINKKELDNKLIQNNIEYLKTITQNNVTIIQNTQFNNAVNIRICDVNLYKNISELIGYGKNSNWKFEFVLSWDTQYQYQFLKGFFFGDGFYNKTNNKLSASCTNKSLINCIYNIFCQNDIYPRISVKTPSTCNGILEQWLIQIPDFMVNNFIEDVFNIKLNNNSKQSRFTLLNKYINNIGRRIYKMETSEYSGKVYNISVEDDESYIVETIPVHNCYNPDENGRSCGHCGSCAERIKNFIDAGVKDPIEYSVNIDWNKLLNKTGD